MGERATQLYAQETTKYTPAPTRTHLQPPSPLQTHTRTRDNRKTKQMRRHTGLRNLVEQMDSILLISPECSEAHTNTHTLSLSLSPPVTDTYK